MIFAVYPVTTPASARLNVPMSILAVGINHDTAPVAIRERVAFSPNAAVPALQDLTGNTDIREAAILSTCNRTELYCSVPGGDPSVPCQWLHRYHELDSGDLDPFLYRHRDSDAVRHILRVAAGLDSMVLGEPEILGQMKNAYQYARDASTLSAPLDRLFQHTFAAAKKVRTRTDIGRSSVSVAYTGIKLAQRVFEDLSQLTVLLVGAGETAELTARHLMAHKVKHLLVANRTRSRAMRLAELFGGTPIGLDELDANLAKADLIIASTGATQPVITRQAMTAAIKARRRRPVFAIDLAVPRDIDPAASKLQDLYLYTLDDLQEIADQGRRDRASSANQAEAIIELEVEHYMGWLRSLDAVGTIREYRDRAHDWAEDLVEQAQRQVALGRPVDEVLSHLAHAITQKMTHAPSTSMREAAARGRMDLVEAARELFRLAESKD